MPSSVLNTFPLLRRLERALLYPLAQAALGLAFVGHSVGGVASPFRLGGEEQLRAPVRPRARRYCKPTLV